MDLKDIDLNLLLVFDELRRQRRVSATAAALGLSQPGVSNALNRLRKLLDDELFLRTPRGMSPTPYAEQIAGPVAQALSVLRETLGTRAHFNPAHSQATLTLALTDVGEIYFLSDLMRELASHAPGVVLNTRSSTDTDLKSDMERGLVDLALGFLPRLQAEVQRRVRLRVPHFMAVAQVLQATSMLAVVPARFAQRVAGPFGLVACPCPVDIPQTAIHAIWHAQKQRDPAARWLRELVVRLFAEHPDFGG